MKKYITAIFLFLISSLFTVNAKDTREISFNLRDIKGVVTEKSYPNKYLLLAIGYTSCPDICPTTLYEYAEALKQINNTKALQPIFVTIDPVNDEINRLTEYTKYFDERIVGLTGEMKNIENLAKQLGATFGYRKDGKKITNPENTIGYTVYHSALIYLINPEGKLIDVFDYQIGAKGLAEKINKILPAVNAESVNAKNVNTKNADAKTCPLPKGFEESKKDLNLTDILPSDIKNTAQDNKLVLLNIWALWCAPCRAELPLLNKLAGLQNNIKVQTLNLSDKPEKISTIFKVENLQNIPQIITDKKGLLQILGIKGLPYTSIFANGKQIAVKSGQIDEIDSIAQWAKCAAE